MEGCPLAGRLWHTRTEVTPLPPLVYLNFRLYCVNPGASADDLTFFRQREVRRLQYQVPNWSEISPTHGAPKESSVSLGARHLCRRLSSRPWWMMELRQRKSHRKGKVLTRDFNVSFMRTGAE